MSKAKWGEGLGMQIVCNCEQKREGSVRLREGGGDLSRFSPRFDWIFPGEALNPIFSQQDARFSEFYAK